MGTCTLPHNFITIVFFTKNLIQNNSNITIQPPITMYINTPIFSQKLMHQFQPFINHGNEAIRTFAPSIAIRNLLNH